MRTPIERRYYLIPAVYLLLIAGLVALELKGTVKIEERLANLVLTATLPARHRGDAEVARLNLDIAGFMLSFDRKEPVELRLASGRSLYAELTGYRILPGIVEVSFGNRLRLEIHQAGDAQSRMEIRSDLRENADIMLPLHRQEQADLRDFEGLPLFTVTRRSREGERVTAVALPPDATVDLENDVAVFRNRSGSYGDLYITRLENQGPDPVAHWFDLHHESLSAEEPAIVLDGFVEAAFLGWTYTRYSITGGTWRMPDSTSRFDERILAAALTEALRRGTFDETLGRLSSAVRLHSDELTYLSAPFIGDIVAKGADISTLDLEKIKEIEAMVSAENPAVFSVPGLLSFLLDRAPTPLLQDLADLAGRMDPGSVSPGHVPGMLEVYLESRGFEGPLGAAFDGLRGAVETGLLPAIHLTDRGYFVASENETVDVETSIRAGAALVSLGKHENNTLYKMIGDALVGSALLLSESEGFLPASLAIDDGAVIATFGDLTPEAVYVIAAGKKYFPKHTSLSRGIGSPAWGWTAAENLQGVRNGRTVTISFDYPVGRTHHFVLRGIEPFAYMTFFGIPWVSDPMFQIYGSGWLYDETAKTLYGKITHSKNREELVISYW